VDGACNQLFPRAGFAMKQHGRVRRRNDGHMLQHFPNGRAVADDVFEAMLSAELGIEIELIIFVSAGAEGTASCKASAVCENHRRCRHNRPPCP